jgi:hypothetical protein
LDARGVENMSVQVPTDTGKPVFVLVGPVPDAADVLCRSGGVIVSYRSAVDVRLRSPAGAVQAVVLAGEGPLGELSDALEWIRHRWPRCCSVVVGEAGDADREVAARTGGALYFARPVEPAEWNMLVGAVGRNARA